jgi:quercetin dioxygenase-like cupin family protein
MTIVRADDHRAHLAAGTRFCSYVSPSRGSEQLCAWRTEIPPASRGLAHRVSHEEVLLVLAGSLTADVDGTSSELAAGDVAVFPAGADVRVDTGADSGAALWVTTSVGFTAELADGATITPPWVQ